MELRQLQYFVVVAKEGHFGRAALKLNVTQPAVSRAVRSLEEEIDVDLFERLPRGVRLAPAGERYLREVERILAELDSAAIIARGAADQRLRELRVGHAMMKTLDQELEALLRHAAERLPNVRLKLNYLSSFEQQSALRDHAIDVGIGHFFGAAVPGLRSVRVLESALCGARVGAHNPLARRSRVSLFDLREEPLLMYQRDLNPQMFDHVVRELRAAGFTGRVVQDAEFSFANWKVMPRNSGWMVANRQAMERHIEDTVCIPVDRLSIPFGIDVIWSEDNQSPTLESFLDAVLPQGSKPNR
ncbi:MAG: LysR family transcriptional regulator [Burkholderiaceae bacterium]